jgi:hypothetical protein
MHPAGKLISLQPPAICYPCVHTRFSLNRTENLVESFRDTARARADARFKKTEAATTQREKAVAESAAEEKARRDKTSKLRELRLAKEAAELAEELANPKPPKKPGRVRKER